MKKRKAGCAALALMLALNCGCVRAASASRQETRQTDGTSAAQSAPADEALDEAVLAEALRLHCVPDESRLAAFEVRGARVVAADLNLDKLFELRGGEPQFAPLPKHPATSRDLALVADEAAPAAALAGCIKANAGENLESLTLFDVYTGEKVGEGKKSLAYNLVFRAADRTLTDEEVDGAISRVLKALGEMGVTLRS